MGRGEVLLARFGKKVAAFLHPREGGGKTETEIGQEKRHENIQPFFGGVGLY